MGPNPNPCPVNYAIYYVYTRTNLVYSERQLLQISDVLPEAVFLPENHQGLAVTGFRVMGPKGSGGLGGFHTVAHVNVGNFPKVTILV